jgi:hypothetical protein
MALNPRHFPEELYTERDKRWGGRRVGFGGAAFWPWSIIGVVCLAGSSGDETSTAQMTNDPTIARSPQTNHDRQAAKGARAAGLSFRGMSPALDPSAAAAAATAAAAAAAGDDTSLAEYLTARADAEERQAAAGGGGGGGGGEGDGGGEGAGAGEGEGEDDSVDDQDDDYYQGEAFDDDEGYDDDDGGGGGDEGAFY